MTEMMMILVVQLIYVPIYTLRTIFLFKNKNILAAILGLIEALINVFGLSLVFTGDTGFMGMFVYAVGYGLGILVGTLVERKLAIGYNSFIVNLLNKDTGILKELREKGFGVTVYTGEGRDGKRYRLDILAQRKREEELIKLIESYEPEAFIVSYEVRKLKGGFLVQSMGKKEG